MSDKVSIAELRQADLNLLVVFAALMQAKSVKAAASLLSITAPAASMALGRLREMLQDDLFVRGRAGMEPTPRAREIWGHLLPALTRVERHILKGGDFEPTQAQVTFRFAAPDDLEPFLVPLIVDRLARAGSGLRLVIRPSNFRDAPARLDSGDADVALTATPPELQRRHRSRVLHRETFAVLHRPGLFGVRGLETLEQYVSVPHVLRSISGDMTGQIDDALALHGLTRVVKVAVSDFSTLATILEKQDGLGNVPETAARLLARHHGLTVATPPLETASFDVSIVWHVRTDDNPAHRWFRDVIAECTAELREISDGEGT